MVVLPLTRRDQKATVCTHAKNFFSYTDQGVERLKWHKLERYFAADAGAGSRQGNMVVKFRSRVRSDRESLSKPGLHRCNATLPIRFHMIFETCLSNLIAVKQIVCLSQVKIDSQKYT